MPSVVKQAAKAPAKKKKDVGVVSRIVPLQLIDNGIKMNVYGRSGTGKTTFYSSFPKPLLTIICSGAQETRSIYKVPGIDMVRLQEVEEFPLLMEHVAECGKYKTVVLDHVTAFQDMVLKAILGLEILPAQTSWGLATQQEYGQLGLQMKEYLRLMLDLPINTVMVAQEKAFNAEEQSELLLPNVASALTPTVTGWINTACDYIVQTFLREKVVMKPVKVGGKVVNKPVKVKGAEYCLRVGPDPTYTTKFRVPKGTILPDVLANPDYAQVLKLINGG